MDEFEVVGTAGCGIDHNGDIYVGDLTPEIRQLIEMGRKAKATISSIYATCEGAGGHYKDALDIIMSEAADFLWPPKETAA